MCNQIQPNSLENTVFWGGGGVKKAGMHPLKVLQLSSLDTHERLHNLDVNLPYLSLFSKTDTT